MGDTGSITFSSLLIGLLVGVQPVSVAVDPGLGAVEVAFTIDDRGAGLARPPDWLAEIDFGPELEPHLLSAKAFDGAGRTVGEARRRVNVPQSAARLDLLLEHDREGRPTAVRLVSTSVRGDRPTRSKLKLDGRFLEIASGDRAALPAVDLSKTHVLSAVVEYSADAYARGEVAFGGEVSDIAGSRLTAVPIRLAGTKELGIAQLRDAFVGRDGKLSAVAVEKGDATVLLVREPLNGEAVRRLGRPSHSDDFRIPFDSGDRVALVWPVARSSGSVRSDLFEYVGPFHERDRGYYWLLADVARKGPRARPPYRFSDAVAVAGLLAAETGTRRAVVLVEGAERRDASQFSPARVSSYLRRLGVPLRLWSLTGPASEGWPVAAIEDVSSYPSLRSAVRRLKDDLELQRVVWVVGDWMPGEIERAPNASGFELLSEAPPGGFGMIPPR